jgi:hypothetical protein
MNFVAVLILSIPFDGMILQWLFGDLMVPLWFAITGFIAMNSWLAFLVWLEVNRRSPSRDRPYREM